jgi:hypothetical protein
MIEEGGLLWLGNVDGTSAGKLYDLSGGRPPRTSAPPPTQSGSPRWQIVSHVDAILKRQMDTCITPTGQSRPWLYLPPEYGRPLCSPDGRRLASGLSNGTIAVIDLDTLKARIHAFERAELGRE